MAAVSAPQASSALTPPSSSHGGAQNSWDYSVPTDQENSHPKSNENGKTSSSYTNGHALSHSNSRPELSQRRTETQHSVRPSDAAHLAPVRVNALARKDSSISDTGSAPDSLLDLYGSNRSGINSVDYSKQMSNHETYAEEDPESSRWIHRDKLARIESRELQAAGIILPRARATSKSNRREHSRDQGNGIRSEQAQKRQRMESFPSEEEEFGKSKGWDLRLPEEAAEDHGDIYRDLNGKQGVSRIPVCKTSPVPIPIEHLERDTPMKRKHSGGWPLEDEPLSYSKPRSQVAKEPEEPSSPLPTKRTVSENSPTKKPRNMKDSVTGNRVTSAPQRPKTKAGNQSTPQRPPTRSGELGTNSTKRPEGDPPWLATMYKPDPRLPPDQQLLPTVAKRLQQEQWEKEGKFGNAYDTSFRPLNNEEFQQPETKTQPETEEVTEKENDEEKDREWPLRAPKSPALSIGTGRPGTGGTGSYSTMPKITPPQGVPQGVALPSPQPLVRVQQSPEDAKKDGCGCCIVM